MGEELVNREHISHLLILLRSYQVTQAICVATKIGIPDSLADGCCKSVVELAKQCGAEPGPLRRLLRTLACHEIVTEIQEDQYTLAPLGKYLQTTGPSSLHSAAIMWSDRIIWESFGALEETIRTGNTAFNIRYGMPFFRYQQTYEPDFSTIYNDCMARSARHSEVANSYAAGFIAAECVVDVGGGYGGLLQAILERFPHIRGILYDMPHVIEAARKLEHVDKERLTFITGNMFDSIPPGGNIYVLSHVLMDHNDEKARMILRNARQAISNTNGSFLLIVEIVLDTKNTFSNKVANLSDLTMLVLTGGQHRTQKEFHTLLESEHFNIKSCISLPGDDTIIECVPV